MKTHQKISEIGEGQTDLNLILMVNNVRTTKNGHNLVDFEDDTGNLNVLFSNKNESVFKQSEKLVRDELINDHKILSNRFQISYQGKDEGIAQLPKNNTSIEIEFVPQK